QSPSGFNVVCAEPGVIPANVSPKRCKHLPSCTPRSVRCLERSLTQLCPGGANASGWACCLQDVDHSDVVRPAVPQPSVGIKMHATLPSGQSLHCMHTQGSRYTQAVDLHPEDVLAVDVQPCADRRIRIEKVFYLPNRSANCAASGRVSGRM
ncbi:MAG: hypothetical protein JWQ73_3835, partial [Variovorax sp.]|nr:hypothetical protein [Variovorax sp.]